MDNFGMQFVFAGSRSTNTSSLASGIAKFVHDHNVLLVMWGWITSESQRFFEWLIQPHVLAVIMAWWITFAVVLVLLSVLCGFNAIGIGAGTLAAAFQSWAYGAFTPAGGIFATLTSLGMLATLLPIEAGVSAVLATIVATVVWAAGAGREGA